MQPLYGTVSAGAKIGSCHRILLREECPAVFFGAGENPSLTIATAECNVPDKERSTGVRLTGKGERRPAHSKLLTQRIEHPQPGATRDGHRRRFALGVPDDESRAKLCKWPFASFSCKPRRAVPLE